MKKTKAIIVYIDNKPKCIEEFSWLWKTWLMWGINEEWDLIAFTNPDALSVVEAKFKHDGFYAISKKSLGIKGTEWDGYGFVNSFAMFDDPYGDIIKKHYEYILKTDCDTFLTKNFKEFELDLNRIHVGIGMYYPIDSGIDIINKVRSNIIATSNALGLNYKNISHVGASMLGNTETIQNICKLQKNVTSTLLKFGWPKENNGDWPGWWKGVASMYGGEIAINHLLGPMHIIKGTVDVFCTDNYITSSDLHIHAWQVDENTKVFNKKKYHNGELEKNDGRTLFKNKSFKTGDYCLMVATHEIHELKDLISGSNRKEN